MLAGVTGLTANSSALAAISDNIANANTVGYKQVAVNFSSLVNSGSPANYSAGGVTASTQQLVTQQGTLTAAASPTRAAIWSTPPACSCKAGPPIPPARSRPTRPI